MMRYLMFRIIRWISYKMHIDLNKILKLNTKHFLSKLESMLPVNKLLLKLHQHFYNKLMLLLDKTIMFKSNKQLYIDIKKHYSINLWFNHSLNINGLWNKLKLNKLCNKLKL